MMPGSCKAGGNCFAAPDTCLTPAPPAPPVPTPYPNTGMVDQADKTADKVKFVGKEVVTTKSEIPRTMGDEPGVNKGVASGTNMDKVVFKKGSSKVKVQGHPCVYHTAMTGHNGMSSNMPTGSHVAPSQTK